MCKISFKEQVSLERWFSILGKVWGRIQKLYTYIKKKNCQRRKQHPGRRETGKLIAIPLWRVAEVEAERTQGTEVEISLRVARAQQKGSMSRALV